MAFNAMELPEPTPDLIAGLEAAGLPTDDLHEAGRRFYRFEDDRGLIGYGGMEHAGPAILIRSIAVIDGRRNAGLGAEILSWLEAEASQLQATALYLLTTSATAFFQRHGYVVLPRSAAPPAIAASRQFSTLCPASAAFMFKELPTQ
ncbi:arsenic resistance N-acetyltransferase ArsN2 [Brevundimonas sp. M1A4_2e]|uniref:arsenic resistance N-acetyltransferase ArsN2 n=1 Tax=Brevundimonas naejangsanensis TaxID=588932 RepID=UPI0026EF9E86|nr:arsenic resistance N-acetyltransferase ArsN2 [Brevundimonas naejangsanensis]